MVRQKMRYYFFIIIVYLLVMLVSQTYALAHKPITEEVIANIPIANIGEVLTDQKGRSVLFTVRQNNMVTIILNKNIWNQYSDIK